MNIIRPIPRDETQAWVENLFRPSSPSHDTVTYPLPRKLAWNVVGGFLYVTYHGKVIGYAKIARVEAHSGDTVGTTNNPVAAGDKIVLEAPLTHMPFELDCRPIRMYKYVDEDLHRLKQEQAVAALKA